MQQNARSSDGLEVQKLLLDMYHQLSIMWGNAGSSREAQAQFQADVEKFDAFLAAGNSLAPRYAPCVHLYQQAAPHVAQQSRYYMQNDSAAFNREGAIATPLIKAGAGCVAQAGGDVFASNSGKPAYNTYVPSPGPSGPMGAQVATQSWQPRCTAQLRQNCYWWLTNPNGTVSHIYQGGPPNCQGPQAANPACESLGNGGPNSSGSTPATGPQVPSTAPAPAAALIPPDNLQYIMGLVQGFGDCAQLGQDLLAAAAAFARGDFVSTANILGVQPGQSMTLRLIASELNTNTLGVTPFEAGARVGRRICSYLVVPQGIKSAAELRATLRRPPPRSVAVAVRNGLTPQGALQGNIIAEAVTADAGVAAADNVLPGKWVETQRGPVQLGRRYGAGKFGNVYALPELPKEALKIGNGKPTSAPSFPRQIQGAQLLRAAGIATPAIEPGPIDIPGNPPMLFMDDIYSKWPGAKILAEIAVRTPAQQAAIRDLFTGIGRSGIVWVDGNPSNIFIFGGPGGLVAGVVDADMVFEVTALKAQPEIVLQNLQNLLVPAGKLGLLSAPNAAEIMEALFELRYGQ